MTTISEVKKKLEDRIANIDEELIQIEDEQISTCDRCKEKKKDKRTEGICWLHEEEMRCLRNHQSGLREALSLITALETSQAQREKEFEDMIGKMRDAYSEDTLGIETTIKSSDVIRIFRETMKG